MKFFSTLLLALFTLFISQRVVGQSILNPADTIATYNGSTTPAQPVDGQIGKWIRTRRLSWNTDSFKCYIYKGVPFRLRFPKSYKAGVSDGKKYPMLVFFHGLGEAGPITDNEYQMYHGGDVFNAAAANGTYDGYEFFMQSQGYWGIANYQYIATIIDYMVANNKLDQFHVTVNGLSAGGQGTWDMAFNESTYIAAALPISHAEIGYTSSTETNTLKFTPMWNCEGGLDGSPAPATGEQVRDAFLAAGANFQYKEYPTLGHDSWDSVWQEPNFWPFMNNAYMSNPWTLFGRTQFCPGDAINVTIGLVPGMQGYQWRKDGVALASTTNTIQVTQPGVYDARVERNGIWSDWSHTPTSIIIKAPTVTPPITVSGLMSDVLPGADGLTSVNLQVPDSGYTSYTWEKVGSSTVLGNTRIFNATSTGQYIVQVTQQFGCSSIFSPPFTVVSATGGNAPTPATSLVANALSFTQVQLTWAQNPNPAFQETGFEIYRSVTTGGPYTFVGLVPKDTLNFTDAKLTPNVKYFYTVRAVNGTGASAISNEANALTQSDQTPPTAPGNLRVVSTSQSTISVAWDSAVDNVSVKNYAIYVNGVKRSTTTQTNYIVDGLATAQQYSIYVVAIDGSGNISTPSNQISSASVFSGLAYKVYTTANQWSVLPNFSTLTPVLSGIMPNVSIANAPQAINYGYIWQGYINVPVAGTYTFATSSDDGSALWFNSYTPTGSPLVNNDGLHGTTTATGTITLQPGVYPICMEFFQGGGGAAMSVSWACNNLYGDNNQHTIPDSSFRGSFIPGGTAPAKPTVIKATAVAYNKVNLTWTDNSNNESGFEIYRATSSIAAYSIVGTTGANATSFTDSTASASTTYFYKIQAVNQYGASGYDQASLGGVNYAYYSNFTANNLLTLPTQTPALTGTQTNVSIAPATSTTNYAFKFSGGINIPVAGTYTFYTASDDGSDLYIGGFDSAHLVVKNDFLQGVTERSGTITLAQGTYPIYVTYFQQGGGASLTASYQGPGITKQNIPDAAFINANSSATTFAVPNIPSAPYGVTATPQSPSVILLKWYDSASTVTGYRLYRSIGDTSHFNLLSNLPSTLSYSDTSLFANQAYYYKLLATGVGGNSGLSAIISATTKDNAPVISKLANRSARYGITTTIPITATDVDASDALSFTIQNKPAFATLVDNGNKTATLSLTPAAGDQGIYNNVKIVVNDNHGGSDSTQFNLTVNNNYDPVMDSVISYTINQHDSLVIPLNATDQNTTDTLTYTVTNAPNSYTLVPVSNGKSVLTIQPTYLVSGTFNVQVNVSDGKGGQAVRNFVVTVNKKDPNLKIYARIKSSLTVGAPWNNLTAAVTSNLLDATGKTTTVGLNIQTNGWNVNNAGPTTGNNSGVYPDGVLNEFLYFGLTWMQQTVPGTISGLDPTKQYNITFFGASNSTIAPDNGSTTYTIGSQTVSLYVQNNTQNTVSINNLSPAADGTISFTMGKGTGATAGYLNALVITNLYDDGTIPVAPTSLTGQYVAGQGVQLNWQSVAYNATGYKVYRSADAGVTFTQIGTSTRTDTLKYIDTSALSNTAYTYKVNASNVHGSSGYTNVFSLTTPARAPQIAAISSLVMKNNQTLSVTVKATGDATDHLTLSATGLPSFATFTDNGNGNGIIKITPKAGITGVFPGIMVTVKGTSGGSASTSFSITVTDKSVASTYINFSDGIYVGSQPWNNMSVFPNSGTSLGNLLDDGNNATGMSISLLDNFEGILDRGMHPGNGQTVYPESVMESAFFNSGTNTVRMQVSGLSAKNKYNFVLFNSHDFGLKTVTNFTINGQTVSLDGTYNLNKTAQINGISPDGSGNVVISMTKAAGQDLALITSLVIQSYDSSINFLSPTDLRVVKTTTSSLSLQWADRSSAETGYEVWRAPDAAGSQYTLLKSLPANTTSYKDSSLSSNTTYYYVVRAVKSGQNTAYTSVATGTTYSSNVYVQLTGIYDAPAPWNPTNMTPTVGNAIYSTANDKGQPTSTGLAVTRAFSEVNPLGMVTGNNSGLYPDNLLQYSYFVFPGITGGLKITGLNSGLKYNLGVIASNAGFGDLNTAYTVNGSKYYLNASLNIGYGQLNIPVQADSNGEVNFTVAPGGSNTGASGCLNGFILSDYIAPLFPTPQPSTVNSKPVITQLANKTIAFGTTLVIPVSATDADGDTLSFTISNNPSFGSFVDNGNGTASLTLNPSTSNAGAYPNIKVVVADGKGGFDSTAFTLTVNNNYPPVIGATQNYTVVTGTNLAINLSATDQNAGDTLTWTVTGLPNTYTLASPSNGLENISLTPNTGTAGVYTVTALVNDGKGGQGTASFTVTVTKPANKAIYTRISKVYTLGTPWNNLTTQVTNNLKDADGNATTVGINLSLNPWASNNQGANTGNNSGVYPDQVLNEFAYFGLPWQQSTLTGVLSGLDVTAKYSITFFASSLSTVAADNGSTNYTIGSQTVSVYVQNNTQTTATISNVSPASDGTITITMAKGAGATAGFVNAIVITPGTTNSTGLQRTAVASFANTLTVDSTDAAHAISAYPNPFKQSFTLVVPAESNERVQVTVFNAIGQEVYAREFDDLSQGTNNLQIDGNSQMNIRGLYWVKVKYSDKPGFKTIKMMRE